MRLPESASDPIELEGRGNSAFPGSDRPEAERPHLHRWAQGLILVALYSFPAVAYLRSATAADPDVWWQMRTGEWILQHGAMPHTDPFSSYAAGMPWEAYSWLFDLILLQLYKWLGLVGIAVFTATMAVLVAVALHRLIRRLQADFTIAVFLTLAASFAISRLDAPRSWWFSILFFALEVDVLMHARKTGKIRELVCLPFIYALWANLHIQFIDGLVVLAIAVGDSLVALHWNGLRTRIRPAWLCGVSAACVVAPLANPYGWTIYRTAYHLASQRGVVNVITEMQAMAFRNLADWIVLIFALAAAATLASARRFALFEIVLLAFGVVVSFRSQRDLWVVVIVSSAILAAGLKVSAEDRFQLKASAAPLIAVAVGLVMFLSIRILQVNNAHLQAKMAESLPVHAVQVVKENGYGGPLYNDYNWGGFLIWALRMPVSVDTRAGLAGDQRIDRSIATWNASADWASDPDLAKAQTVILPAQAPLVSVLRMDPHFDLVFEDKIATVFVARKAPSAGSAEKPPTAEPCAPGHLASK